MQNSTYVVKQKEYNWCTGPGHHGPAMWVRHTPSSYNGTTNRRPNPSQANLTDGNNHQKPGNNRHQTKAQIKANIAEVLAGAHKFGDDVSNLVTQIMNKIN